MLVLPRWLRFLLCSCTIKWRRLTLQYKIQRVQVSVPKSKRPKGKRNKTAHRHVFLNDSSPTLLNRVYRHNYHYLCLFALYPSVFIYCMNLHQFLILCSLKAMMFVKLYFRTNDIYLISLVSLDPSGFHLQTKWMPSIEKEPVYDMYCICRCQYHRFLNIMSAVGIVDVWWSARHSCHGSGFESRQRQNILQHLSAQLIHYIPLYLSTV